MAIKTYLLESFESHTNPDTIDDRWGKWYIAYNLSAGVSRTGDKGIAIGENSYCGFAPRENLRMIVIGFAIRFRTLRASDNERLISIFTGTTYESFYQLELELDYTGVFKLYRGSAASGTLLDTGTTVIQPYAWYYIELRIYVDDTNGEYELKIDGVTEFSDSTVDTQNDATYNYVSHFLLRQDSSAGSPGDNDIDDVYVRGDTTTNTAGGFLGPVSIKTCRPNANGTDRDWACSTGTDDYALVDEQTYSSTDYLYDSTDGNQVTMGFENCTAGATIKSVILCNWSYISSGAGRDMIPLCRSNGTVYQGSPRKVLDLAYEAFEAYDVDPDTGSAWTESAFNAAEFGVETD